MADQAQEPEASTTLPTPTSGHSTASPDNESETQWVRGHGRLIFLHSAATPPFNISLSNCPLLLAFFLAVTDEVPIILAKSLPGIKLCPRMVLSLQDTGGDRYSRHAWTTFTLNQSSPPQYSEWFNRNVVNGQAETLNFEIHILDEQQGKQQEPFDEQGNSSFSQKAREAGRGGTVWTDIFSKSYRPIWRRIRHADSEFGFIREPVPSKYIVETDIVRSLKNRSSPCWGWLSTLDWFPERCCEDPEEENRMRHDTERSSRGVAQDTNDNIDGQGAVDGQATVDDGLDSAEPVEEMDDPQGDGDEDFFGDDEATSDEAESSI